jgi:hypothetical protein
MLEVAGLSPEASASITTESPMRTSVCLIGPPGSAKRSVSSAPKASVRKSISLEAPGRIS